MIRSLKDVLIVTRAWSFTITFIPVTLGTILAHQKGRISLADYGLCLLGALSFHAAANILNDYFDLKNHIDSPQAPTALYRPHPVFTHILTPRQLLVFSMGLFAFSSVIGVFFAVFRSAWIWFLLFGGLLLAFFYTGGPKGFKYIALGEPAVFLAFGPLMMEGAYAVQRSVLSSKVFYVSIPVGLLTALVLLANNLRDIDFDAQSGIRTLGTILGKPLGLKLFGLTALLPFALVLIYVLLALLSRAALLVFLSLPIALRLIKRFSENIPVSADAQASQLSFFFGLCLILSALLGVKP